MWYQTQQKLTGKNRMREIIEQSSSTVNGILFRNGSGPKGMDPKQAFVNGTVNVVSEFSFGLTFDIDDPSMLQSSFLITFLLSFQNSH